MKAVCSGVRSQLVPWMRPEPVALLRWFVSTCFNVPTIVQMHAFISFISTGLCIWRQFPWAVGWWNKRVKGQPRNLAFIWVPETFTQLRTGLDLWYGRIRWKYKAIWLHLSLPLPLGIPTQWPSPKQARESRIQNRIESRSAVHRVHCRWSAHMGCQWPGPTGWCRDLGTVEYRPVFFVLKVLEETWEKTWKNPRNSVYLSCIDSI